MVLKLLMVLKGLVVIGVAGVTIKLEPAPRTQAEKMLFNILARKFVILG